MQNASNTPLYSSFVSPHRYLHKPLSPVATQTFPHGIFRLSRFGWFKGFKRNVSALPRFGTDCSNYNHELVRLMVEFTTVGPGVGKPTAGIEMRSLHDVKVNKMILLSS
jgi:hypothetical protein